MYENATVLVHSNVKITGDRMVYVDPFQMKDECHDADLILSTHDHYDHFSTEDIDKIVKTDSWLVLPACMKGMENQVKVEKTYFLEPGESIELKGVTIQAVPAYNVGKQFHPKEKSYVGYLVTMDGVTYYIAGDTDINEDNQKIHCDVAFLPVGGKYTMNYQEAAKLANFIQPKLAIPTHYGAITGEAGDGEKFAKLVDEGIEVRVVL